MQKILSLRLKPNGFSGYSGNAARPDMERAPRKQEKQLNMTFCVLSALAIVMVVAGHIGYNVMTAGDLFPYYSFHIPLFMFISGYFYGKEEAQRPLAYVKKKVRRLIVPYLIWNLFYGAVAWAMRGAGFAMGEEIGVRTLLVEPFLHGYQFIYNYAAWFVPVLFVVEMLNLAARLVLYRISRLIQGCRKGGGENGSGQRSGDAGAVCPEEILGGIWDLLLLTGGLLAGMAVVWFAMRGQIWTAPRKMLGRILFLFPCFQMGHLYKTRLEKHDTLGNVPYFAIVIGIQTLLCVCCNGLAYSAVWCTGFANGPLIPYVTCVSGIAFWLRVARLIARAVPESRAVRYLGRNTYAVMMHHVMAFMLVKMAIAGMAAHMGVCGDFDFGQFYTNIDYFYLVRGAEHFKMVYLAAGVALPLMLQYGIDRVKGRMNRFAIR